MGRLNIFFSAAFFIRLVSSLPQPASDWDLMESSDPLPYETSSLLPASPSDGSNLFSSDSSSPMDTSLTDLSSSGLDGLAFNSGASPEIPISGDDSFWDDPIYSLPPDIVATGCSGTFGKRNGAGDACAVPKEEAPDPCDPDKEAMCCSPTWMLRSRWPGGGFAMDNCVKGMYLVLGIQSLYCPNRIPS